MFKRSEKKRTGDLIDKFEQMNKRMYFVSYVLQNNAFSFSEMFNLSAGAINTA